MMPFGYAAEDAKPVEKWHFGYKSIEETVKGEPPIITNYFFHDEIKPSAKKGKR